MTRRLAVLAVAAAAVTTAAPAQAAVHPVCAARLVNAAADASTYCSTGNTPMLSGATVRRVATVEVAAGVARATITCGYGAYARSTSQVVSGPQPVSFSLLENSPDCRTDLVAVYPNTTAAVTSTFSYAFIGPGA